MFYDTKIVVLDLGNFETSNIKKMDHVFNYSNYLKFINLRPYNGKNIFNSIKKENVTICVDESKTEESEYQTLKDLNAVNNCTDYCFYEFNFINGNKTGCDLDCPNIIDKSEMYYDICYPPPTTILQTSIIIPKPTEHIVPVIPPKSSVITTTPKTTVITTTPKTTVITTTPKTTIPVIKTTVITIAPLNTTISLPPLKLLHYGYDKFRIANGNIYFNTYFRSITDEDSYPSELNFSTLIYCPNAINKTATCKLKQNGQLLTYNCQVKLDTSSISISNVTANLDLNFNRDYILYLSPQSNYTRGKLQNQTEDLIIPEDLLILIGNISSENDYFSVKGDLTGDKDPDDDFTLTIYDKTTGNPYNISCVSQNKSKDNYEIRCNKDQIITANLNNTLGNMDETKLLLIINDGNDDLYKVDIPNSTSPSEFKKTFLKSSKKLSAGGIVAIVLSVVLVLAIVSLLTFMIKKKLNNKAISLGNIDEKESRANSNVYIMN